MIHWLNGAYGVGKTPEMITNEIIAAGMRSGANEEC